MSLRKKKKLPVKRDAKFKGGHKFIISESEEMNQVLINTMLDGVAIVDFTGKVIYFNPAAEKIFEIDNPKVLMGKNVLKYLLPASKLVAIKDMVNVSLGKGGYLQSYQIRTARGRVIWIENIGTKISYGGKSVMIMSFRDISERKKFEEKIEVEAKKLSILNDIIVASNESINLAELLESILILGMRLLNFDAAGIYLVDQSGEFADVVKSKNIPEGFLRRVGRVRVKDKPYSRIFVKGESIVSEYYEKFVAKKRDTFGFKSLISVPLVVGDKVIGALNFVSKRRQTISADERIMVESIGKELGSTVKKMQMEKDLIDSEKRYRVIFENTMDIIYSFNPNGKVIFVSPNVTLWGYQTKEVIGADIFKFVHPDDVKNVKRELQKTIKTSQTFTTTFRLVRKDGTFFYAEEFGKPVYDGNGRLSAFTGVIRDITGRKMFEEELKCYSERMRIMFEDAPDAYYISSLKGILLDGNKAAEKITGYERKELVGNSFINLRKLVAPGQKSKILSLLSRNVKGESTGPDEFELIKKDGTSISVEITTHPVKINGKSMVLGIARDISQRKLVENSLKVSEERFSKAFQSSPYANIMTRPTDGKVIDINASFTEIAGFKRSEAIGKTTEELGLWANFSERDKVVDDLLKGVPVKGRVIQFRIKSGEIIIGNFFAELITVGQEKIILSSINDITEKVKAEEKLRLSEERYRNVVEKAAESIVIAQDGKLKFFNPQVLLITGYSRKELEAMPFIMLVHPDDRKMVAERYTKRLKGEKTVETYPFRIVNKRGEQIWGEIRSVLITWEGKPATLSFLQEITGRKRAEDALNARVVEVEKAKKAMVDVLEDIGREKSISESLAKDLEKFKLAVDGASDLIVITDINAKIVFANRAAERITGFKIDEMIGHDPGELWGGQMNTEYYKRMWQIIKKDKKVFSGEFINKRKNGETYDAEVHVSPIMDKSGDIIFFVSIEKDITQAKEVDRMKTEFVSIASHQLRTPLTTMKWYAELLVAAEKDLSKKHSDYVHRIYDSSLKMVRLVNDLLNVSRIETGKKFAIEKKSTDMVSLVKRAIADQSVAVMQSDIKIELVDWPEHIKMMVDEEKMYQVFQNLINNAVKYSNPGGKVEVRIELSDGNSIFSVKDMGLGIPLNQQGRVFEKFFRGENVTNAGKAGTGLGLYIVKAIVEGHGGRIWFESGKKTGTIFYFELSKK
ncbi:MAG: PAS domain S-box protein [Candidatus Magasanikbacteria bacterium]|nr:PAS domain S-box protein [Candidatus Magasanikbacteria bacterium]